MKKLVIATAVASTIALALAGCAPTPEAVSDTETDFPKAGSTIELVVPFSPGGDTDLAGRALATSLADTLGVNVEVINTPGAGGQLGLTALATAAPDGYTIGFTNLPSAITTYLVDNRGATYDRDSFIPLGGVTRGTNFLAVNASSEYETLQELLDAAKAAPGEITIGTAGDDEQLGIEAAASLGGVEFNMVPFDGGSEKTTALLGSQVDAIVGGPTTVIPGVKNGDFRAIGVFSGDNDPFLPDVPTFQSLGIDLDVTLYLTVSAPAGTPAAVVTIMEEAIAEATENKEFQDLITSGFKESYFASAAEVAEVWAAQEATFAEQLAARD